MFEDIHISMGLMRSKELIQQIKVLWYVELSLKPMFEVFSQPERMRLIFVRRRRHVFKMKTKLKSKPALCISLEKKGINGVIFKDKSVQLQIEIVKKGENMLK